jgi:chromosome segregation and condensation protein ScpB
MRVAVRENITNVLLNYPKGIHVNELSKIIKIEPKKLARVLRLLATRGCYNEGKELFVTRSAFHLRIRQLTWMCLPTTVCR